MRKRSISTSAARVGVGGEWILNGMGATSTRLASISIGESRQGVRVDATWGCCSPTGHPLDRCSPGSSMQMRRVSPWTTNNGDKIFMPAKPGLNSKKKNVKPNPVKFSSNVAVRFSTCVVGAVRGTHVQWVGRAHKNQRLTVAVHHHVRAVKEREKKRGPAWLPSTRTRTTASVRKRAMPCHGPGVVTFFFG